MNYALYLGYVCLLLVALIASWGATGKRLPAKIERNSNTIMFILVTGSVIGIVVGTLLHIWDHL